MEVVRLCNKYEVKVIEDCAHSFLTKVNDQPTGSFGHIAIYSMRKTLAKADGGGLKINIDSAFPDDTTGRRTESYYQDIYYLLQRFLEFLLVKIIHINICSKKFASFRNGFAFFFSSKKITEREKGIVSFCGPSNSLITYLNSDDYLEEIMTKRRDNFMALSEKFQGTEVDAFFKKLPKGCVPQGFIIKDKSGMLCDSLRSKGVGAAKWPDDTIPIFVKENPDLFPIAHKLNRTLVMLPLHQDLPLNQINYLSKVLIV